MKITEKPRKESLPQILESTDFRHPSNQRPKEQKFFYRFSVQDDKSFVTYTLFRDREDRMCDNKQKAERLLNTE